MRKIYKLIWNGGEIEIDSLGCKMLPTFNLNGEKVKPLHEAEWVNDTSDDFNALPGILQNLKGEFPCVPFGINSPVEKLTQDWKLCYSEQPYIVNEPHGYCSNKNWELVNLQSHEAEFKIEYPENDTISFLKRKIKVNDDEPNKIFCTLQINVKKNCELPIGLHPMIRIPKDMNQMKIIPGKFEFGLNYPGVVLQDKTLGRLEKNF